jgi:hypothetical protein
VQVSGSRSAERRDATCLMSPQYKPSCARVPVRDLGPGNLYRHSTELLGVRPT